MKKLFLLAGAMLALPMFAEPLQADDPKPAALAPSEIVAAAPGKDWMAIASSDLLVMELAPDTKGKARRVVIQLMPSPFSQGWIGNIRKLAAAHWWDGTAVVRVQDNYVAQWGDPDGEDPKKAKPLPEGLLTMPEWQYRARFDFGAKHPNVCINASLDCPEWHTNPSLKPAPGRDSYALITGFYLGWPVAAKEEAVSPPSPGGIRVLATYSWPVHCYGMVGVGRDMPPNTGTGAELYTVIGHAPRHLDRNIALVGRVIEGMENLSSLPRGHGALGFYDLAQGDERVAIQSVRLGNEVPDLPRYEYLSTESESFARYADARANRRDAFFIQPAGGADICNIPVPVRRAAGS